MEIRREWQMPNKNTFDIKPIKELILKYKEQLPKDAVIVDPFANKNKIANITNDLDPQYDTTYHMDATDFLKSLSDNYVDMLLYDPPYCYDKETELFTKEGWKKVYAITTKDELATLDETNQLIFQKPTDLIQRDYVGKMISIKNNFVDLLVTPNHNCLVKNHHDTYEFVCADDLCNLNREIIFKNTFEWSGNHTLNLEIPECYDENQKKTLQKRNWYTPDCMRFLGLFIRYGELTEEKGKIILKTDFTSLHQEQILERLFFKLNLYFGKNLEITKTENEYNIVGIQLYQFLQKFTESNEKCIPQFIKQLSRQDLSILLGFLFTKKSRTFTTTSKKLANDTLEIILKSGFNGIINQKENGYEITLLRRNQSEIKIKKEEINEISFDDKIYCITIPNNIVLAKRDGKVCWCGNSPRQVSECYKSLGQTVNMETTQSSYWSKQKGEIGRLVKKGGYVITCAWNSGGIGKKYGFEIVEILLVAHGGWHNDTIVTVEKKIKD